MADGLVVPLTRGAVSTVAPEDYERVTQFKWCLSGNGYACRGYQVNGKKFGVLLHRFILNAPKGIHVDYIDGDILNNKRSNLRLCNPSQNLQNQVKKDKTAYSRFKGVCWHKDNSNWVAHICVDKKMFSLGSYDSEIDAARVYDAAAWRYFGAFSRLNFPVAELLTLEEARSRRRFKGVRSLRDRC